VSRTRPLGTKRRLRGLPAMVVPTNTRVPLVGRARCNSWRPRPRYSLGYPNARAGRPTRAALCSRCAHCGRPGWRNPDPAAPPHHEHCSSAGVGPARVPGRSPDPPGHRSRHVTDRDGQGRRVPNTVVGARVEHLRACRVPGRACPRIGRSSLCRLRRTLGYGGNHIAPGRRRALWGSRPPLPNPRTPVVVLCGRQRGGRPTAPLLEGSSRASGRAAAGVRRKQQPVRRRPWRCTPGESRRRDSGDELAIDHLATVPLTQCRHSRS
jgi:hypothetical protein